MVRAAALTAALLLGACSETIESSPEDVAADAGYDGAVDALAESGLETKIDELETQIASQESEIELLSAEVDSVRAEAESVRAELEAHSHY